MMAATDNMNEGQFGKLSSWAKANRVELSHTQDESGHTVTIAGPKRKISQTHASLDHATDNAVRAYNRGRK